MPDYADGLVDVPVTGRVNYTGAYLTALGGGDIGVAMRFDAVSLILTETTGSGTYTANWNIPAGTRVVDVLLDPTAVWAAATSASLTIGDTDSATGYVTAQNMKTLVTQISTKAGTAGSGAYASVSGKYYPAAKTLSVVCVTVGAGATGITRVTVVYALAGSPIAANKQ